MFLGHIQAASERGSCQYQTLCRRVAYTLQEPIKDELDRLQKQEIIVTLNMNETSKWCNSFALVPKANGKVWLCMDPARLNKVLIRLAYGEPSLNDILHWLAGVKYLIALHCIDAS